MSNENLYKIMMQNKETGRKTRRFSSEPVRTYALKDALDKAMVANAARSLDAREEYVYVVVEV